MARPVLVVGLMGRALGDDWDTLLDGRVVLARCAEIASQCLPDRGSVALAYDEFFEREQLSGVESTIAQDIARRAETDDVAYLVPGPGWVGDASVSELNALTAVEFADVRGSDSLPAHAQIVDALTLAQAQERTPFDSGSRPLDATVATVILNWHGQRVIDLASARLSTTHGQRIVPNPDQFGMLHIPACDPLDSPPSFAALEYITARLRQPDGCPWDREQNHESLLDDFASEVEEYSEAIRAGDWSHAAEELGDVLLNVLMQAQIGTEGGHFRIEDVLSSINAKLVRRHPHVFAGIEANSPEDVLAVWNSVKQQEKNARAASSEPSP
ncbi:MAG TPA: MazG nucleotide pyrophosphohydrolase domain-containing protein [Thermomicrobiales bacterium]|nr:MazG nucleotide pyrophosphohydrolase domain-containing protein [Thermomicrobiales bacterium]